MPKNKHFEKKNTTSLLIILVIIAVLLLIFVFIWQAQKVIQNENTNTNPSQINDNKNEAKPESWSVYTDPATKCRFSYPSTWEITENYYYETPGGVKSSVPTIILAEKQADQVTADLNQIQINLRQSFCLANDPLVIKEETVGDVTIDHYIYYQSDKATVDSWCMETVVNCLDINGQISNYQVVSNFNEESVGDIFKEVAKSFAFEQQISNTNSETQTADPYEGWLTYNNETAGFSLKYPSEYSLTTPTEDSINIAQEVDCSQVEGYCLLKQITIDFVENSEEITAEEWLAKEYRPTGGQPSFRQTGEQTIGGQLAIEAIPVDTEAFGIKYIFGGPNQYIFDLLVSSGVDDDTRDMFFNSFHFLKL